MQNTATVIDEVVSTPQYPQVHKLKWLVDTNFKVEQLIDCIAENIDFNKSFGKDDEDLDYQLSTVKSVKEIHNYLEANLVKELETHPAWNWLSKINGIDPVIMGKLVGAIRFWPPKKNVINENTGKSRWAHSQGALLMYCGLGIVQDNQGMMRPQEQKEGHARNANYKLKNYILSQVDLFLEVKNKYFDYYSAERENLINQYTENGISPFGENTPKLHTYAARATAVLFISHLWEVVRSEIGLKSPANNFPIQEINELYNEPWNMIDG